MQLNQLTAHEIGAQFRSGEVSSVEVTRAVLDSIARCEPTINAFISIDDEGALAQAAAVDAKLARGDELGPLAGIPVAVKDVLCVRGGRTTCGSHILSEYVAPYDATAVQQLRRANAVLVGKTNMDEFAMGSSCENSYFGATHNPVDPERVPGGSSGGSAAAVAADETIVALGSDTGGSVRQPAGYCGVVGLKPTYGRVSRYGLVAYASSLDQVGPLAKDVEDASLLLSAVAGHDRRDATSADLPVPDYGEKLEDGLRGLRIGMASEYFGSGLDPEIRAAIERAAELMEAAGAELVEIDLPVAGNPDSCVGAYYIIATAEASANLSRYDGVKLRISGRAKRGRHPRPLQGNPEQWLRRRSERRIMLGTYVLSAGYYDAYYLKAQKVRTLIRRDFERAFEMCDVLLSPVAPTTAFRLGEQIDDALQMYLNDIYTVSVNLAGIPGICVPFGSSSQGLPIGAQLLAAPFEEAKLLTAARGLELIQT